MRATVRTTIWTTMLVALVWLLFLICAILATRHLYPRLAPVFRAEEAMVGAAGGWLIGGGDPQMMLVIATVLWGVVLGCALALCVLVDRHRAHHGGQ
jgi:hypothetical protein